MKTCTTRRTNRPANTRLPQSSSSLPCNTRTKPSGRDQVATERLPTTGLNQGFDPQPYSPPTPILFLYDPICTTTVTTGFQFRPLNLTWYRCFRSREAAQKAFHCTLGNLATASPHGGLLPFQVRKRAGPLGSGRFDLALGDPVRESRGCHLARPPRRSPAASTVERSNGLETVTSWLIQRRLTRAGSGKPASWPVLWKQNYPNL